LAVVVIALGANRRLFCQRRIATKASCAVHDSCHLRIRLLSPSTPDSGVAGDLARTALSSAFVARVRTTGTAQLVLYVRRAEFNDGRNHSRAPPERCILFLVGLTRANLGLPSLKAKLRSIDSKWRAHTGTSRPAIVGRGGAWGPGRHDSVRAPAINDGHHASPLLTAALPSLLRSMRQARGGHRWPNFLPDAKTFFCSGPGGSRTPSASGRSASLETHCPF